MRGLFFLILYMGTLSQIESADIDQEVYDQPPCWEKYGILIRDGLMRVERACEEVKGKDATVVIGNTGTGKSTFCNLLCGIPMEIDGGRFVNVGDKGARVGDEGQGSITKVPAFMESQFRQIGLIVDMPGLRDTCGFVEDILVAACVKKILLNAKSTKVVLLTSSYDLQALRSDAFQSFSKAFKIFDGGDDFLLNHCVLVVNNCDLGAVEAFYSRVPPASSEEISRARRALLPSKAYLLKDAASLKQISDDHVYFLPRAPYQASVDFINGYLDKIITKIAGLECEKARISNLSHIFSEGTSRRLTGCYREAMLLEQATLYDGVDESVTSSTLDENYYWYLLRRRVESGSIYQQLSSFSEDQYQTALEDYKTEFSRLHAFKVKLIRIKEMGKSAESEMSKWIDLRSRLNILKATPGVSGGDLRRMEEELDRTGNAVSINISMFHTEAVKDAEAIQSQVEGAKRLYQDLETQVKLIEAKLAHQRKSQEHDVDIQKTEEELSLERENLSRAGQNVRLLERSAISFSQILTDIRDILGRSVQSLGGYIEAGIDRARPVIERAVQSLAEEAFNRLMNYVRMRIERV